MLQIVTAEKLDKKWDNLSSFHVSRVMVLKLSKKALFSNLC